MREAGSLQLYGVTPGSTQVPRAPQAGPRDACSARVPVVRAQQSLPAAFPFPLKGALGPASADYTMRDVERLHEREAARRFHLPADEGQWDGEGRGALARSGDRDRCPGCTCPLLVVCVVLLCRLCPAARAQDGCFQVMMGDGVAPQGLPVSIGEPTLLAAAASHDPSRPLLLPLPADYDMADVQALARAVAGTARAFAGDPTVFNGEGEGVDSCMDAEAVAKRVQLGCGCRVPVPPP